MASELAQQKEPNTPWWYETPSLVSQTTHLSAFASSADSTPFDVTPSVSSGYYDEDDSSNVSEGSYGGRTAHGHTSLISPCLRTDSNWSNSTITEGRSTNIFNNGSLGVCYVNYCPDKCVHIYRCEAYDTSAHNVQKKSLQLLAYIQSLY